MTTGSGFIFNNSGAARTQSITGAGTWAGTFLSLGPNGSITNLTLMNDVAFAVNELQAGPGSFDLRNPTLTHSAARFFQNGSVLGAGTFRMQPTRGTATVSVLAGSFTPEMKIASGTVSRGAFGLGGPLTVDTGATFSLLSVRNGASFGGNVMINGTVNTSGTGSPFFEFRGNTFTNNGSVASNAFVNGNAAQNLAGVGSWTGTRLFFGSAATAITTLQNDVTYAGGSFYVDGRLNTGAFKLTLPCTVAMSPFSTGDVIGDVRRTNLSACPGAIFAFGNPFTTIQFTSGTPPTEITVNVGLTSPAGFPNAAMRTYIITPTGGSGYTGNLRLHYLDSELNGNPEFSLKLWRNDGTNWNAQGVTNIDTTQNWVEYAGVTQFSPWAISGPNQPTDPIFVNGFE